MSVIGTEPNFPKTLNTTDGTNTKTMSTFESDEHLRATATQRKSRCGGRALSWQPSTCATISDST
jgi:hypothetical protein